MKTPSKSTEAKPSQRPVPSSSAPRSGLDLENLLLNYILLFITCAIIGWLWEVIIALLQHGTIVNRGVLHGPWLPIYGFGALGIVLLFNRFKKYPWLVFLSSSLLCGIIEYCTSWYLETFKHLKWWEYNSTFLNLDGRVCGLSLLAFGIAGLLIVYLVYPTLTKTFNHLGLRTKKSICLLLVVLFLGDFIYSSDNPNTGEGITSDVSAIYLIDSSSPLF